jgi:hypothetical protein
LVGNIANITNLDCSWLIVWDNLPEDDIVNVRDIWPVGCSGSILITTRDGSLPHTHSIPAQLQLQPVDLDTAKDILLQAFNDDPTLKNSEVVDDICATVGFLPLALSQLAGFLSESCCSFEDCLSLFRSDGLQTLQPDSRPSSTMQYDHTVSTVWDASVSLVQSQNPSSGKLLNLLGFLDHGGIPFSLFKNPPLDLKLRHEYQALCQNLNFSRALRVLLNRNLVGAEASQAKLWMHPLLHEIAFNKLSLETSDVAFEVVVELLLHRFPGVSDMHLGLVALRDSAGLYSPHILQAMTRLKQRKISINNVGSLLTLLYNYSWYESPLSLLGMILLSVVGACDM